jgi:23S rRNA (uracil1939-C5)-methyltransferase
MNFCYNHSYMENFNFKIEHIDPLGQGVSKENKIAFIEKTLPGETGTAEIYRKAKGVIFGRLLDPDKLEIESEVRIIPECPHYNECRGCQYLHTDYENEIIFKTESLNRLFKSMIPESIKIITHSASQRFSYRNRVQIHYDLETDSFGLISSHTKHLINASDCLLPETSIKDTVADLYKNKKWKDAAKTSNEKKGYIEVYLRPGETTPSTTVNKPYAEGGFTQVNNNMGLVLTNLVTKMYKKYLHNSKEFLVLDIFGGNGNLSKDFKNAYINVYDLNSDTKRTPIMQGRNQHYVNIDLYKKDPVNQIINSLKSSNFITPDLVVFDPPRAGVKFIESYLEKLDTQLIFYISCDPATLKRDSIKIQNKYNILEMHLIDIFPGTRHFETLIVFRRKA